jgi:hypothetical protein
MGWRSWTWGAFGGVALIAATAPAALGCSCLPSAPREMLARADAAFVGVVESRRPLDPGRTQFGDDVVTFRVERALKGPLGERVEVRTSGSTASCGLEARPGDRAGLVLGRDARGAWQGGLCGQVDPTELQRAAAPLPRLARDRPARLLLGGPFGDVSSVALDGRGRPVGYARRPSTPPRSVARVALAPCPGGRRVLEAFGAQIIVRTLPALRTVRRVPLPGPVSGVLAMGCVDPRADGIVLLLGESASGLTRLVRISRGRVRVLRHGPGESAVFAADRAFIGHYRSNLVSVDLRTGRERTLSPVGLTGLSLAPDGSRLAGIGPRGRASIVDGLRTGRVRVHPAGPGGSIAGWADPATLIVHDAGITIRNARGRLVRRIPAEGIERIATGAGRIYAQRRGRLYVVAPRKGSLELFGRAPVSGASSLVAVEGQRAASRAVASAASACRT